MIKSESVDINLHPLESYAKNKYKNLDEKNDLVDLIINDIKEWKNACSQLDREDNYLGSFCITKCDSCFDWYVKMCEIYSEENNGESMKWSDFFNEFEKFNYTCGSDCKLLNLDENLKKEYNDKQHHRKEILKKVQELQIGYRVALEQQKNLSKQLNDNIQMYKEKNAILIFKKKSLQYIINSIQISIILVSSIITFFEAIQSSVFKNDNENLSLIVFPIICSTYIGLILAIGRFFKFDIKNEQIIKLIEKYSFIINKLRQKRSKYMDFDFKIHDIDEWNNLLSILEKDSIDDIIMKANEECDLILTPKQYTHYKKKYTKTRMKDLLERKNYDELSDIIIHNSDETAQKQITMHMIKKRNFCRYYFCFLWLCFDRDYLDYNSILVKHRDEFYDVDALKKNRRNRKRNMPRMRRLAGNVIKLKSELKNTSTTRLHSPKLNALAKEKKIIDQVQSRINNNQNNLQSENKQKKISKVKKNESMYDSSYSYNFTNQTMKNNKRNSFSNIYSCSDTNAWLHLQKNKKISKRASKRSISKCDFSAIRDLSKNGVYKKNSSSSENSSNKDDKEILALEDISNNVVLNVSENTN